MHSAALLDLSGGGISEQNFANGWLALAHLHDSSLVF